MKMTYMELACEVLKKANRPLNTREIWDKACEMGLDKKLVSIGKTPDNTISVQLYNNIKTKQDSIFIFASKKPTTFWLKSRESELENLKIDDKANHKDKEKKAQFKEEHLHSLLVKFLYESRDFNLFCKTIDHKTSIKSKSGKDMWIHPDIVGVYFPYREYQEETLNLLRNINQSNYKIFSFELKISLDFSNLKESYFQAVSNSSWANEGYLVVFEELDDEVLSELRRLNQSFGIGVIKLERDVSSSKILLGAKERELDIQTLDMLLEKNKDFKEFIKDINKRISTAIDIEIKDKFDEVLDDEAMQKYLKEKHILGE